MQRLTTAFYDVDIKPQLDLDVAEPSHPRGLHLHSPADAILNSNHHLPVLLCFKVNIQPRNKRKATKRSGASAQTKTSRNVHIRRIRPLNLLSPYPRDTQSKTGSRCQEHIRTHEDY
jgi:hypothetical protein